jgi:orotidine-5'-phosphate decarboxylase
MKEGSNFLVMGRSLLDAKDPEQTLREVVAQVS